MFLTNIINTILGKPAKVESVGCSMTDLVVEYIQSLPIGEGPCDKILKTHNAIASPQGILILPQSVRVPDTLRLQKSEVNPQLVMQPLNSGWASFSETDLSDSVTQIDGKDYIWFCNGNAYRHNAIRLSLVLYPNIRWYCAPMRRLLGVSGKPVAYLPSHG